MISNFLVRSNTIRLLHLFIRVHFVHIPSFDISILKSSCIYYSPKRSNEDGKERLLLRNCFIEKNSVLCFKLLFDNLFVTNFRNNILRTISSLDSFEGDNNHGKMLESYARKASFEAIRRGGK